MTLKRSVAAVLDRLAGRGDWARHAYHRLIRPIRTQPLTIGHVTSRFWTPSEDRRLAIEYCGGEHVQLTALVAQMTDRDCFWDVGANDGLYSVVVGCTFRASRVVAFEPQVLERSILRVNCWLNGLRVHLFSEALADTHGFADFFVARDAPALHSLRRPVLSASIRRARVELVRGDEIVKQGRAPSPSVMKIDVEGAELAVLRGIEELPHPPRGILVEVHPTLLPGFGHTVEDVRAWFGARGYRQTSVASRGTELHWLMTR